MWDTKDKRNIEAFVTEYETYCDALGYRGDKVRVRSFGSFLKEGASITFVAWQSGCAEDLERKKLKDWAVVTWRKPHEYLLDVPSLDTMKWRPKQNLSMYVEEYKSKYLQYDCGKNPQLRIMGAFLVRLVETIWCKCGREKIFSLP